MTSAECFSREGSANSQKPVLKEAKDGSVEENLAQQMSPRELLTGQLLRNHWDLLHPNLRQAVEGIVLSLSNFT